MDPLSQEIPDATQVSLEPSQMNIPTTMTLGLAEGSTSSLGKLTLTSSPLATLTANSFPSDTLAEALPTVTLPQPDHGADIMMTTFVYMHIRTLCGIMETFPIPLEETRPHILGWQATKYLRAHGYTSTAVDFH